MKFSFQHRAFYCYIGMSAWIFFLITVVYKYMTVSEDPVAFKVERSTLKFRIEDKFRKTYIRGCNPPENIVRGSEGAVDNDIWALQGFLVVTRHGDRGPLTHLKDGDKLPCDTVPNSPLLKSYEEYVLNASASGRAWWVAGAGPFHNFPSLPHTAATHCALGQLTPKGLLQMITVGNIFREAYGDKIGMENLELSGKKDTGSVAYSTRYRRTFQSLQALSWGMSRVAATARESHSVAFCFRHCACNAHHALAKKISTEAKQRLESHPGIKDLISKLSKVLMESQEYTDADVIRDAILGYMCHDVPLPCSKSEKVSAKKQRRLREEVQSRNLLEVDIDVLNMELDYLNQMDFNNEFGRKARDLMKPEKKMPLDFDAQMEREKLLYYQQRYLDNGDYDDVMVVKKNLDGDFNFPNDPRADTDFDEEYKEPTTASVDFCIKKEHVMSIFAYLEWSYRLDVKNLHSRRKSLLLAYGLIHNIVQNMIRMISEGKPKIVVYSGHDKTLQALMLALGINQHYYIQYASRMIFEVYRKKDLRDEFKFTKRRAIAQDFYFRVVYNGKDVTDRLSFCKDRQIVMKVGNSDTYLCSIENIVRFIHDDYFSGFNVSNYKDACATFHVGHG